MRLKLSHPLTAFLFILGGSTAFADSVVLDDQIVVGKSCIGQDCINGEAFGFETLKLKENNTRLKFDDTSASASFPARDWQITANESDNGGLEKFSIEDITAGRTPFTIEGNAPANSLYVDDGGRVGFGTSAPAVELHVKDGDSPTLRLEQDTSSGFGAQTWDLVGNEANFFIRDLTNGSKLVLKIKPGAPADSLFVEGTTGDIGLRTTSPEAPVHVQRSDGTARIYVDENSGTQNIRELLKLSNNGGSYLTLENTHTGGSWYMVHENNDPNRLLLLNSDQTPPGQEFALDKSGNLTLNGKVTVDQGSNAQKQIRELMKVSNNGGSYLTMENTDTSENWYMVHENNAPNRFLILNSNTSPAGQEFVLDKSGNLTINGQITTGGITCGGGCDQVFEKDYPLLSIKEHARLMWANKHLPNVGPTKEGGSVNLTETVGRMLNELEHAHIYIAKLEARLERLEKAQGSQRDQAKGD